MLKKIFSIFNNKCKKRRPVSGHSEERVVDTIVYSHEATKNITDEKKQTHNDYDNSYSNVD